MCEPSKHQLEEFFENVVTYLPDCDVLKENYQTWIKLDERVQYIAMSLLDRGLIQPEEVDVGTRMHMIYNRLTLVELRAFDTWSSMQSEYGAIGNSLEFSNQFNTYSLDCEVCKLSVYVSLAIHEAWNTYQMHRSAQNSRSMNPFNSPRSSSFHPLFNGSFKCQKSQVYGGDQEDTIILSENGPINDLLTSSEVGACASPRDDTVSSIDTNSGHDLHPYQLLSPDPSPRQPQEFSNLVIRGRKLKNPYDLEKNTDSYKYHFGSNPSTSDENLALLDQIEKIGESDSQTTSTTTSSTTSESSSDWQELPNDNDDGEPELETEDNSKNEIFFDAITGDENDNENEPTQVEVNNNSTNETRKARSV